MGSTLASLPTRARVETDVAASAVPWQLAAVIFAATSVIVGLIWDISWHMTIGRDTFWTPAHLAIYTGGAVAGLASGFEVLRRTFVVKTRAQDDVTIWRVFHGPLGGWLCIWGAVAMLTSAPFDDWWHNAYGLDVKIISPPHALLALGFVTILAGAVLMAVAHQSREEATTDGQGAVAPWLVAYANGLVLTMLSVFTTEFHDRVLMHSGIFYLVSAIAFPYILSAASRNARLRYPATAAAAVYTLVMCAQVWILPLFEGSPKLGPIGMRVTHMVPMDFPLLLLPAAFAIDLVRRRIEHRGLWLQALVIGVVFLIVHVVTQWPFGTFLMTDSARNAFFRADNFPYMASPDWYGPMGRFFTEPVADTLRTLGLSAVIAVASARLGLSYGGWLRAVKR
jgi:hypothetical protein